MSRTAQNGKKGVQYCELTDNGENRHVNDEEQVNSAKRLRKPEYARKPARGFGDLEAIPGDAIGRSFRVVVCHRA